MSGNEPKRKSKNPWRSLHAAIWLIGIAILATYGWWWPGILVLVAVSGVYEAFVRRYVPQVDAEESQAVPTTAEQVEHRPSFPNPPEGNPATTAATGEHRFDLLPASCPSCNAPVRNHEVKWTGFQSANCPYCGSNLPMSKS